MVESEERTFRWCDDFRRLSDMNVELLDRLGEYVGCRSPDVSALRHSLKAVRYLSSCPLVVARSVSPLSDDCISACM